MHLTRSNVIVFIVSTLVLCALVCCSFCFMKTMSEKEMNNGLNVQIEETKESLAINDYVIDTPQWNKDGYSDLQSWWNDLQKLWAETEGITNKAIDQCGKYLNEEEKEILQQLEYDILHCYSIKECKEKIEQFDSVVINNLPPKKTVSKKPSVHYNQNGNYSTSDFMWMGVIQENGWKYTWYSQNVLPGGGLDIPGRHVGSDNLIHDEDGYICVAANRADLAAGAVVDTPFGPGKVYDTGCAQGTIDIYTNF